MAGSAHGAGARRRELLPLRELACVLRESGCPIQLAHLSRCRLVHLAVSLGVIAVACLLRLARFAIPVENDPLFVV